MTKILVVFFLLCSVIFAQTPAQPAQQQVFTDQQRKDAQDQMKKLGEVFGVKPTESKQAPNTSQKEQSTTIAGVADKALDMVGNAVASISATIQKVAPEIWRIMIRQQYANAIGMIIEPLGFLMILLIFRMQANKLWQPESGSDGASAKLFFVQVAPIAGQLLSAGFLVLGLSRAFQIFINPEYYAVRDLLQTLIGASGQ